MKFPSLFKIPENSSPSPLSWPWPLPPCTNPKTLSFRAENPNIFSEYYGYSEFSNNVDNIETVIEGLKKEKKRLFFEPGETSSILEKAKKYDFEFLPFKESCVVMTMDSMDPFLDFKKSMEEMVEANHEIKDCEKCLEDLLTAYLKVNEKSNHRYIIDAFFDLLISLSISKNCVSSSSVTTTSHSFTSPLSFCCSSFSTSPCLSLLEAEDEIIETNVDSVISSSVV